ncbi:MAG: nucleotidyltransferase [Phycisphaeraceae bacterium]|nr:nucleotidyltransferase [Phycisphaeraceae bacterium]
MPRPSRNEQLIRRVAKALDDRGVHHVIIGGQAVNIHGHSRFTRDVDFTTVLSPFDAQPVLDAARHCRLQPLPVDVVTFIMQAQILPCHDPRTGMGVDFSFVDSPYLQEARDRAVTVDVAGYPVRFLSVEDLLIHKAIAGRRIASTSLNCSRCTPLWTWLSSVSGFANSQLS